MDSYESLMNWAIYEPIIAEGDSRRSILNMVVEGRTYKAQCKPCNEKEGLNKEQIVTLKNRVNQGAINNWDFQ